MSGFTKLSDDDNEPQFGYGAENNNSQMSDVPFVTAANATRAQPVAQHPLEGSSSNANPRALSSLQPDTEDDDDDISLESHDGPPQAYGSSSQGRVHTVGPPVNISSIKNYIKEKKVQLDGFNPKQFVANTTHQMQEFNVTEYMNEKRRVFFRAVAGEFLVTLLFMFTVCSVGLELQKSGQITNEAKTASALTTGFASIAYIYAFADVSGAHFNPAVTFATIVTGKTSISKGVCYIAAQLLGSLFAMAALVIAFPGMSGVSVPVQLRVAPAADVNIGRAFFMEFMLTFILVYVIFAVAFDTVDTHNQVKILNEDGSEMDKKDVKKKGLGKNLTIYTTSGSSKAGFAPLSIGLTLGFLCFLGGSVSGGVFNPARAFTSALCSWDWSYQWLYWLADLLGAAAAGSIQQLFFATKPTQNSADAAAKAQTIVQ